MLSVMLYDVIEEWYGTVILLSSSFEESVIRMCFTSAVLVERMGLTRRSGYNHWTNMDELVTNTRGMPTSVRLAISIGMKK